MAAVNIWMVVVVVVALAMVPCAALVARSRQLLDWYIAVQWSGILAVLLLIAMARAVERPAFIDLALTLAVVEYTSSLLFVTVIERWL